MMSLTRSAARLWSGFMSLGYVFLFLVFYAGNAYPDELDDIPVGHGLPVVVHVGVFFHDIADVDENAETFEATTDVRVMWHDSRLKFHAETGLHGYKEFRFDSAERELKKIWSPKIRFSNRLTESPKIDKRLRIFPDGKVELTLRSHAQYQASIDLSGFPFDRQKLPVELFIEEDTTEFVDIQLDGNDTDFSGVSSGVDPTGWKMGLVNIERKETKGWNGDRYATLVATAAVKRDPSTTVSTIFIPLLASLLIPLLATWINGIENGNFIVEASEPVNVVIGGLFATIALAFTISSAMPSLMMSLNAVTLLLGLNYAGLAFGFLVTMVFYRFELPKRYFGRFVQEAAFEYIVWAFPAIMLTMSATFVLLAMC